MSTTPASPRIAAQTLKPSGRQKRPRVSQEDRRRVLRACDACRKQKEKCEGGVPCRRCSRLQRQCQFKMSSAGASSQVSTGRIRNAGPASTLDGGSGEKMELMERIIKHVFGEAPCDTDRLRKILDSLREADGKPTELRNNADDMDDFEEMSVVNQEFTVKPLSNNTSHYSGELSHWSFWKRVQEKVGILSDSVQPTAAEPGGVDEFYRAKQLQSSGSTISLLSQYLPPQPVGEYLIAIFFRYAQTNYYYVEEDWALAQLQSWYSQSSSISSDESPAWCILLMLLAIGTQFADLDSTTNLVAEQAPEIMAGHDIAIGYNIGLTLYKLAVQLVPDVITIASMESVQAFLLLGVYTLHLDASGLSYTYLGVAIKMAIQNGMHRKHSPAGLELHMVEMRNRLWWTAYTLEKRICILHGRPVSISQADTDAPLISDLPNYRPSYRPANFANMQAMIKLTIQLESIAVSIVKLRTSNKMLQADRLHGLVLHSQNLKDWWSTLPNDVYCRDLDPTKPMFRPNVHLHLTFHLTQVFLGRPFLFSYKKRDSLGQSSQSRASSSRSQLKLSCVEAAFAILDLCQLLQDHSGLARASYTEFSTCRAALLVFLAHSLNDGTERLRNALTDGMRLMRLMARGIDSAKSELSLIEALERAVRRLDGHSALEEPSSSESHQSSGYEKFKRWARLWEQSPKSCDELPVPDSETIHDTGDLLEMTEEPSISDSNLNGFSTFPTVLDEFGDFQTTNDFYSLDFGGFPDMGLEQSWQGYQMFDA